MKNLNLGSCSLTVQVTWLAIALVVPLAFNPFGQNSFELPKADLLRALVLLLGIAALAPLLKKENRQRPLKIPPLFLPALAYGSIFFVATLVSTDFRTSLFGSYERQQGLLTIAAYLSLFLVVATRLSARSMMERLWQLLVWGSLPVVAYGLVQAVMMDPLTWQTDSVSPVFSTMGRSNFLGTYLVLVIPLTAGQLVLKRHRLPLFLLLASQITCLVLTQARGAWIGIAVAGLIFALAWSVITHKGRPVMIGVTALVSAIGLVALLNVPGTPLASLPGIARLATLAHTDEGATAARLTIWQNTLPLIAESPWLGYGPETMRPVFFRVFPPQLVYYQGREVVVDRAHNLWLDTAMSGGVPSVIAVAALFIFFARLAWRGLREASDRWTQVVWIGLASAVGGHLVDLQFGFDLTASSTVFWLLLGFAAALASRPDPVSEGLNDAPRRPVPRLLPAVGMLTLATLLCGGALLADFEYGKSQQPSLALTERLQHARNAVQLWPLEPEYRLGLSWLHLQNGDPDAAETQLVVADQLAPGDPLIWSARGELYAAWGQKEPNRFRQAEAAYRRVLELAPNVASYHTALGLVLVQQGKLDTGTAELERAIALDATDGVAYRYLADLYLALGRESEAAWAHAQAARWG